MSTLAVNKGPMSRHHIARGSPHQVVLHKFDIAPLPLAHICHDGGCSSDFISVVLRKLGRNCDRSWDIAIVVVFGSTPI